MQLNEFLRGERGRCAAMAALVGVAPAYLSQMANGVRPVPSNIVPALEVASAGAVRRWDLRPDDWHRIWPDLVGAEGAPAVPEASAQPAAQEAA